MEGKYCILITVLVGLSICVSRTEGMKQISDIIDSLFRDKVTSPKDYYDRRIRPNYGGPPVKVSLSAHILDLYNIDEKNHEFTAQLYLRQSWTDNRLGFQPPTGVKEITLDPDHAKKMWYPDTFVVNERKSLKHDLTVNNEFTSVSPDGEILRSIRTTVTASCKMNLKWFPFDRHICSLVLESYGSKADDFYFEWQRNSDGQPKVSASKGASGTINQKILAIKGATAYVAISTGNYSRASIELIVARVSTRYIQDVYFPAIVLVIIAFITMSVGALQFRVLLSTICMVGIVIFTSLLSQEMPKVSYQTAMDFFVFKCSFMIFNVVIVNFIMYHLLKPRPISNSRMRMRQLNGAGSAEDAKEILPDAEPSEDFNVGRPAFDNRFQEIAYKMCMYSKYTMPLFFTAFNVIYWPIVLSASNSVGDDDDFILREDTS